MSIKGYFEFVYWYYKLTGKERFDKPRKVWETHNTQENEGILRKMPPLSGKERLFVIILSYFILVAAIVLQFFSIPYAYICLIVGILFAVEVQGVGCRFSLIYYAIIYPVYANRNRSLNDNVIFHQKMLYNIHKPVHKTIAKYFKFFRGKITYRYAEFHLVDKTKKNPPNNAKVYMSLRFTTKAVFFNGEKVFDGRMTDLSQLEECLENIIASGKGVPIQHKK
jgi:hypothetical protein